MILTKTQRGRLPPDQTIAGHLLRWGAEHPGITAANPQLNTETYTLTIEGEVENPVTLNWKDFLALPQTVSVSDFHCVEGWSVLDCRWEGVRIRDTEKLVKPRDAACAVTFECADGYTTSLFREELATRDKELGFWERRGYSDSADVWKKNRQPLKTLLINQLSTREKWVAIVLAVIRIF